jgi:microcystin-dependent protein
MGVSTPNRPPRTTPNLDLPVPGDAAPADVPTDLGNLADALDLIADRIRFQPGDLKFSAATSAGPGWLACNGQSLARAAYPDLFAAIGTTYGAPDANSFNAPDYRGRMLVGSGSGFALNDRGGVADVTLTTAQMPSHAHTDTGHSHSDNGHLHSASAWQDAHAHANWSDGNTPFGGWQAAVTQGTSGNPNTRPGSVADQWVPYIAAGWSLSAGSHAHYVNMNWVQPAVGVGVNWGYASIAAAAAQIAAAGGGGAHTNMPPYAAANVFVKT